MTTINEEIQAAKLQIESLKTELEESKKFKDDTNGESFQQIVRGLNANIANLTPHKMQVRRILKGHFGKVICVHWAGNGKHLVSASQDGKLFIWDAITQNKLNSITMKSSWVMTCCYEQENSKMVACGGLDNVCSIYNLGPTGSTTVYQAHKELSDHEGYLSSARFINENKIITSSGDSCCRLWDIVTSASQSFEDHKADVMSIALSPISKENVFVSGSCDATAKLWDIRQGRSAMMTYKGHESDINSVAFFPDGNAFATGSDDSLCKIFDLRYYGEINSFNNEEEGMSRITSVDFSSSGRLLFSGSEDHNCYVWDTLGTSKEQLSKLDGHHQRVATLGVTPLGDALCTGSWDCTLRIWA